MTKGGRSVIHGSAGPLFSLTEYAPLQTPVPCFTHSVFHLSLLLFGYFSLALLSLFYISKADTMHTGRDTGERQYRVFTLVFVSDWFPCVFTDDLLGKRRSFSPNSSSECPSESKKLRSVSPKGRQCICVLWCYRCVKLFEGKKTEWLKRKDGSWLGRWWMSECWPQFMFLQIYMQTSLQRKVLWVTTGHRGPQSKRCARSQCVTCSWLR